MVVSDKRVLPDCFPTDENRLLPTTVLIWDKLQRSQPGGCEPLDEGHIDQKLLILM